MLQPVGGAWFDAFADAGDFAFYAYGLGWSVLVGEVLLEFSDGEKDAPPHPPSPAWVGIRRVVGCFARDSPCDGGR